MEKTITSAEEGFGGNGYDRGSLAAVLLEEKTPSLVDIIRFDPKADMFAAYTEELFWENDVIQETHVKG